MITGSGIVSRQTKVVCFSVAIFFQVAGFFYGFLELFFLFGFVAEDSEWSLTRYVADGLFAPGGRDDLINAKTHGGRNRLAEYLLRHPFSLQKITGNTTSKTVIYRSKRHLNPKRNFEIFKAPDFIAAALLHLPPKASKRSATMAFVLTRLAVDHAKLLPPS